MRFFGIGNKGLKLAIYHCSVRTFSRSEGHSAVAAAAYRSGAILRDERTGRVHRYEKRHGVIDAFILAPNAVPENFLISRADLWNAAEASENRKNSRVAREVILALPHELDDKARAELSRDMGLYLIERYRVAVDVAIHSPVKGDGHDPRNHHAHLLFTTRELTKEGFGAKTRVLDDKFTGPEEIEIIREVWEILANDALVRAGFDVKIDRRSLEDQGVDRIPQIHEGKAARNAKSQTLLDVFDKAKEGGDDEETDEEGSGEKSSSSGSSSKGQAPAKSESGKSIDYQKIDNQYSRLTFNDEIKSLNEKRSEFSAKPLPKQVEQLDRMMTRLDRRLERLERLEKKTAPRAIVKHLLETAVRASKQFLAERKQTVSDKHRQSFKKVKQHGKRRQGIRTKMTEARRNMDLVEGKKLNLQRYRGLIDRIQTEMKRPAPQVSQPAAKTQVMPIQKRYEVKPSASRITNYKVVAMRDTMQDRMTSVLKPLRRESMLPKLKASVAMKTAMQEALENKNPAIRERVVPANKASFNTNVHAELTKPIVKIKADLGVKFTPLTKIDFKDSVRRKAAKSIVKIKADIGIKILDPEVPKAKGSFNAMSGATFQKPLTKPKFGKRTLH